MIEQQIQLMKPGVFVRFTNQSKTTAAELPQFRCTSAQNTLLAATARYGTPFFVHALKKIGVSPDRARLYRLRDDRYRKEFPVDWAEMRMIVLMMLGKV